MSKLNPVLDTSQEEELLIKNSAFLLSPLPIAFSDFEGKITSVNQAYLDLWGYEKTSEVIGKPTEEFGTEPEKVLQIMEAIRQTGQWKGEDIAKKKDGSPINIFITASLVKNKDDQPLCILATFLDITEQKKSEKLLQENKIQLQQHAAELELKVQERTEELAKSERKLHQAHRIALLGHWEWNVETNKLIWSEELYNIFEFEKDKAVTFETILERVHPEDTSILKGRIADWKEEAFEYRIITKSKKTKHLLVSTGAISVTDKENIIYQGVIQDITERKKTRLQIIEALGREKEMSELKSRFVSMASHEFRTPLSSILSSAELLGMYINAGKLDKTERSINRIKSSVGNLTGILNDFLSLEKLESGKVKAKIYEIALDDFLKDLSEEIIPLLRPDQQLISNNHIKNLVQTDPYLLKNILINLISNAIKYSPNGENVTLEITNEAEKLVFKVIDQGIGIPEADKAKMFSRFFRASNVENIKGTGLGLTIVKRYLDLMQGSIDFESEHGKGSTFFIILP